MATAVQHVDGSAAFDVFPESALCFGKSLDGVGHGHVDIDYPTRSDGSFGDAGVVAYLNLRNVPGFHLTENKPDVSVEGHVVNTQVIVGDEVLVAPYH